MRERTLRDIIVKEISSLGGMAGERGGNSSARYTPGGARVTLNVQKRSGMQQIEFPEADDPVNDFSDHSLHLSPEVSSRLANTVQRDPDTGRLVFTDANREDAGDELGVPGQNATDASALREVIRSELRTMVSESAERINWSRERDADGSEPIGLVPKQMDTYETVRAEMPPRQFLALSARGGEATAWMVDQMAKGTPIAPPFLKIVWVEDAGVWYVPGHEGRHRAHSAIAYANPRTIPVDLFIYSKRTLDGRYRALASDRASDDAIAALSTHVVSQRDTEAALTSAKVAREFAAPVDIRLTS